MLSAPYRIRAGRGVTRYSAAKCARRTSGRCRCRGRPGGRTRNKDSTRTRAWAWTEKEARENAARRGSSFPSWPRRAGWIVFESSAPVYRIELRARPFAWSTTFPFKYNCLNIYYSFSSGRRFAKFCKNRLTKLLRAAENQSPPARRESPPIGRPGAWPGGGRLYNVCPPKGLEKCE